MRSCSGRNEIFLGNVASWYKCAGICDENRQCVSFEWWGADNQHPQNGSNFCTASSSCTYENSKNSTEYDPADLYVKGTTLSIQYLRKNIFFIVNESRNYIPLLNTLLFLAQPNQTWQPKLQRRLRQPVIS